MSDTGFYSRRQQVLREWRVLFRIHGLDTFLGGFYVLAGFFFFRTIGNSQVYNVVTPFVIASIVTAHLSHIIAAPQSRGATLKYYFGLPRERTIAWDAQAAYIVFAILWLETIIVVGALFKVGGAGMTPIYRFHPETFVFPFLTAAVMLACVNTKPYVYWLLLSLPILVVGLRFWFGVHFWSGDDVGENYIPDRVYALGMQYVFAIILIILSGFVLHHSRRYWRDREVGEIL